MSHPPVFNFKLEYRRDVFDLVLEVEDLKEKNYKDGGEDRDVTINAKFLQLEGFIHFVLLVSLVV